MAFNRKGLSLTMGKFSSTKIPKYSVFKKSPFIKSILFWYLWILLFNGFCYFMDFATWKKN